MNVRINKKFGLRSDARNIILDEYNEKGKVIADLTGYYHTMDFAFKDLLERSIKRSEATTLVGIAKDVEATRKDIANALDKLTGFKVGN